MGALDNLVKGAAGQAVQNMNLLFGCAEEEGLAACTAVSIEKGTAPSDSRRGRSFGMDTQKWKIRAMPADYDKYTVCGPGSTALEYGAWMTLWRA